MADARYSHLLPSSGLTTVLQWSLDRLSCLCATPKFTFNTADTATFLKVQSDSDAPLLKILDGRRLGSRSYVAGRLGSRSYVAGRLGSRSYVAGRLGSRSYVAGRPGSRSYVAGRLGSRSYVAGRLDLPPAAGPCPKVFARGAPFLRKGSVWGPTASAQGQLPWRTHHGDDGAFLPGFPLNNSFFGEAFPNL